MVAEPSLLGKLQADQHLQWEGTPSSWRDTPQRTARGSRGRTCPSRRRPERPGLPSTALDSGNLCVRVLETTEERPRAQAGAERDPAVVKGAFLQDASPCPASPPLLPPDQPPSRENGPPSQAAGSAVPAIAGRSEGHALPAQRPSRAHSRAASSSPRGAFRIVYLRTVHCS